MHKKRNYVTKASNNDTFYVTNFTNLKIIKTAMKHEFIKRYDY